MLIYVLYQVLTDNVHIFDLGIMISVWSLQRSEGEVFDRIRSVFFDLLTSTPRNIIPFIFQRIFNFLKSKIFLKRFHFSGFLLVLYLLI